MNIISPFKSNISYKIGVNCGSYGKAKSCDSCAMIFPKDSCFGDCGWVLNKTTHEYNCVDRGNDNIPLNRRRHPYICLFNWHNFL